MSETKRSVGEDRENDSLSIFGEAIHKTMSSYVDTHPKTNFLFVGSDQKGYVMSGIGNPEMLAEAFMQAATKDEVILKALVIVTSKVSEILHNK